MEYFGNLLFNPVVEGEHDAGDPKAVKDMKKYLFSSKTSPSPTNGTTWFFQVYIDMSFLQFYTVFVKPRNIYKISQSKINNHRSLSSTSPAGTSCLS